MPRRVALRAAGTADEPNVVIPLASSFNERGVTGYTHSVTNSEDQRKINCFYELAKNSMTGKGTLTLTKRPGVTISTGTYGTSAQTAYLVLNTLRGGEIAHAVFYLLSGDAKVSATGGTATILSPATSLYPSFVDLTAISNVRNAVIQLTGLGTHRVFFATVANVATGGAWTEIVDVDFTTLGHTGKMEHLDGFAFILTDQNLIINSDTNSLANWTAANFLAKQIRQDRPIGLMRLGNQLIACGDETSEMFFNNGNTSGSPLGRLAHLHARIGLVPTVGVVSSTTGRGGTHYYATIEKRLYFVGRRSGGGSQSSLATGLSPSVGVFAYDGANFEKVSTSYIDKILSEKFDSIYSVNEIGFGGSSAVAIGITAPGVSPMRAYLFFPDWKEWFEWTSDVFSPVNSGELYLGLGSNQHKLYSFAGTDKWQDDTTSYAWSTQFKLPTNGASRRFMPMYGVDADTDASANNLTVEISTNDCVSFSTLGTIDQTQDRKILFRGGSFRKAHIRLGNTNARPSRLHQFLARIE